MTLAAYIAAAMLSWSPAREHVPDLPADTEARYALIAGDIAAVAEDEREAPLPVGDRSRAQSALVLASVAFFESRFWTWVDDGSCNSRTWRAAHHADAAVCDGSHAFSMWQIHTEAQAGFDGIALDESGWHHDAEGLRGRDLINDRRAAARVALHMLRQSLTAGHGGGMCGYTGESQMTGCVKGKARLELALRYRREHTDAAR
jgi:hypothetical protein